MKGPTICLLAMLGLAPAALADELRLKDGTKILGTIVGFEENAFRVETSYGFALVRRDKVASIVISEPGKDTPAAENKALAPAKTKDEPASPKAASSAPNALKEPVTVPPGKQTPGAAMLPGPPAKESTPPPPAQSKASATPATTAAAPDAAPQVAPGAPPSEPPMREEISGNTYVNYTYGFRMYKPPSWQIIEGARKTLPNAVVAMGTSDETTLLVVGRERLSGSLAGLTASTEQRLRDVYENYRALGEERTTVAGLPATTRRFRGTVEGHDWSGRVVSLARGDEFFTIIGMTYADSDLIQIQENVIAKTVSSLEFIRR